MNDPYKVLGLPENATDDEIKKARRKLLFDLHSDRLPKDLPEGAARLINEKVLEINDAYNEIARRRASRKSNPSASSAESQARNYKNNYTGKETQNTSTDSSPKQSAGESDQAKQPTPSVNKVKTTLGGRFVNLSGKVVGALIGVILMQTCRSLIANRGTVENARNKAEEVIYSGNNYCPELVVHITQGSIPDESINLKLLSELYRISPEGSQFRSQVNSVVQKILSNETKSNASVGQERLELFREYFHVACRGSLQVARLEVETTQNKNLSQED